LIFTTAGSLACTLVFLLLLLMLLLLLLLPLLLLDLSYSLPSKHKGDAQVTDMSHVSTSAMSRH
jgi:hypothetical protein